MGGVKLLGKQIAFGQGLDAVEGDSGEVRNVFEAREEVGGCGLNFGAGRDGAREG